LEKNYSTLKEKKLPHQSNKSERSYHFTSEAKSILKPIFDDYCKAIEEQQWDEAATFHDADTVLIQTGKKGVYGREAVKQELMEIENLMGKTTARISEEDYQMTSDFIILKVDFEITTDKMGVLKGKSIQIWRKRNKNYLIYHEEFSFA
ncbi:hypothetical protein ANCCAN_06336, partial [Ancylostoma caninum]